MQTIQITIDEPLLKQVDTAIRRLHTTRSAFIRHSLEESLHQLRTKVLEDKHRQGYQKKPATKGEFDIWHDEQDWGEAWNGAK